MIVNEKIAPTQRDPLDTIDCQRKLVGVTRSEGLKVNSQIEIVNCGAWE
jgi:hypothetical protein